jgi:hypothetical protein
MHRSESRRFQPSSGYALDGGPLTAGALREASNPHHGESDEGATREYARLE